MEASLRREHGEVHQPVLYLGLRLDLDPDQGHLLHKIILAKFDDIVGGGKSDQIG